MKVLLTLFCFLFQMVIYAQVELKMLSLEDPELKVCYAGITNLIKVEGIDMDASVNLKSNRGKVVTATNGGNAHFQVTYSRGKTDTLCLFRGEELLFKDAFEIRSVPDPYARLGNIKGNSCSLSEILDDPVIRIVLEDCDWKHKGSFADFDIILLNKEGHIIYSDKNVKGFRLTEEHVEEIKKLREGDTLIIKGIIVHFSGAAGRSMLPISITIKS